MLSEQTIKVVKATVPVLVEHGETLTNHFYQRMFNHNPEVAPFFNPKHQKTGQQPKALAAAIVAYASNIDNLTVLGDAVELIAQKHASLMIKKEHYPIVGENLLASIKEVLGDAATDDIINAWGEAYGFLAEILINREQEIYDKNATKNGGWEGFKKLRIIKKEKESNLITSFYFSSADGSPLPNFLPGQYITLKMATEDGNTTMRNYSLSDKPGQGWFRISVKKEISTENETHQGYVSNKLHNNFEVGDLIEVGPPCGEFCLNLDNTNNRPLVFLAAGVGITPILSMVLASESEKIDRKIYLIHGCINEETQAFKTVLDDLESTNSNFKVHYCYSEPAKQGVLRDARASTGKLNMSLIQSILPNLDAEYYFCGPQKFMATINQELLNENVPAQQMHFEFFGPKQELKAS